MDSELGEVNLVWPARVRWSQRDEREDEVEKSDLRQAAHFQTEVDLTRCLGIACPMTSDVCDVCQLSPAALAPKRDPNADLYMHGDIAGAKSYVDLAGPRCRGSRACIAGYKSGFG